MNPKYFIDFCVNQYNTELPKEIIHLKRILRKRLEVR